MLEYVFMESPNDKVKLKEITGSLKIDKKQLRPVRRGIR